MHFEGISPYKYFSILPIEIESLDLSTAKEKYKAFIQDNYVPVFYRDLYQDTVCDGLWDVVLYEENGKITAAYIFMIKQKITIKYIIQPQLCPYTGPIYFNPTDPKQAYSHLIRNLPKHQLIIQDYFHNIPKFENIADVQSEKHTYLLDKSTNIESLWQQQSPKHRGIIRKAEKNLRYGIEYNIDVFLDFVSKTFKERGKTVPNDPNIFQKLDKILLEKGLRKIVKCTDKNNVVVAMCYFIIDEQWTYNFANSVIEDYRHYGMNLILWNELKTTISEGRSFDFEGSIIPGIDEFFKRFKGTKTFYQSRYKSANRLIDYLVRIKISKWDK